MLLILCCSADLPHSYACVPHWAEEVGNSNNVGKLLYPLVDLRNKAVIQILLTSKILRSDGILIPL